MSMNFGTRKIDGGSVTYCDNHEIKDILFEKLLKWFVDHQVFNSETIFQCDEPSMAAPELLAELADDVFKFEPTYDEDV